MRPIILFCAGLMILWGACKKSEVHKGSPQTKAMSGSRSYYKIDSGYDYSKNAYWGDSSDVTVTIVYDNDASIWFGTKAFSYDTTSDGLLIYQAKKGSTSSSTMTFDPNANVIKVRESYRGSTGVIDQTTDYVSH